MTEKTFLLELRDQAKEEPNAVLRDELRYYADRIEDVTEDLFISPTPSNMVRLNGLWAHAQRLLMRSQEGAGPEGGGGAMRVDELEEAA